MHHAAKDKDSVSVQRFAKDFGGVSCCEDGVEEEEVRAAGGAGE